MALATKNNMALPSRPQTFAYENCRELLMKLEREIERYLSVAGSQEDDQSKVMDVVDTLKDAAFNASVTAWHLADWVFHDLTPEQRKQLNLNRKSDLQERARQCPALRLCELACAASKHWVVSNENIQDDDVEIIVSGDPGWMVYFREKGQEIPAQLIFEQAFAFWNEFIRQNEVAPGDKEESDQSPDRSP